MRPANPGRCDGHGANRVRAFHRRGGAAVHCERPRHAQHRRHRSARLLSGQLRPARRARRRAGRGARPAVGRLAAGHLFVGRRSRARGRARDAASRECRGLCALARRRRRSARDLQTSRPGHFTNGSATRYSARSTGILPDTSSSSCGKPLRRATPANNRAEPPAFLLPSGHAPSGDQSPLSGVKRT